MTSMPLWQQIATIALCVLGTMTTRFLPFSDFQTGKPSSRLCEIPGESASFRRFCPAGGVLPEGYFPPLRQSRHSGSSGHGAHGSIASLETADASLHGRGHTLLDVSGAVYLLTRKISSSGRKGKTWQKKKSTCEYSFFHGDRYGIRTHTLCAENAAS